MTDAEDAANAEKNRAIDACDHRFARMEHGIVLCPRCWATFVLVKLPRKAVPRAVTVD